MLELYKHTLMVFRPVILLKVLAQVEDVEPPSPPTDSEPKGTLRRRRPKPLSVGAQN